MNCKELEKVVLHSKMFEIGRWCCARLGVCFMSFRMHV